MPQAILPLFPSDATSINGLLSFACRDGQTYYFHGSIPIFSHTCDDLASFRMFTSQLYVNGLCTQAELMRAFGVPKSAVIRAVKKYREGGPGAFFIKKKPKRQPRVLTEDVLAQAQALLDEGRPRPEIAESLGLKVNTLSKAINTGRLAEKKGDESGYSWQK